MRQWIELIRMAFFLPSLLVSCSSETIQQINSLEFVGGVVMGKPYSMEAYTWASNCSFQIALYTSNGTLERLQNYVSKSRLDCAFKSLPDISSLATPDNSDYLVDYQKPKIKIGNKESLKTYPLEVDEWLRLKKRWVKNNQCLINIVLNSPQAETGYYLRIEPFTGDLDADWFLTNSEQLEVDLDNNVFKIISLNHLPLLYSRLQSNVLEPGQVHIVDIAGRKFLFNILYFNQPHH